MAAGPGAAAAAATERTVALSLRAAESAGVARPLEGLGPGGPASGEAPGPRRRSDLTQ